MWRDKIITDKEYATDLKLPGVDLFKTRATTKYNDAFAIYNDVEDILVAQEEKARKDEEARQAKVAAAAKAAAAKVPARAVISAKPSSTAGKNSAKATISGLKPGQKVKVTVNVKGK